MTLAHTTGTITLTNGSAVITGIGTDWQTAGIVGGMVFPLANGNVLPIATVTSNTQMTAAVPWIGATGTYSYSLVRDTAYLQQLTENAELLTTIIRELRYSSLAALAALAGTMAADKFAYATGLNTMAWTTLSAFGRETLALGDAAAVRSKIGAYSTGGGALSGSVSVTGNVTATNSLVGSYLVSNTPAGTEGFLALQSGGLPRFLWSKSSQAETGANAGSNLTLGRWSDAGGYLGTPMIVSRQSGAVSFPETPFMAANFGANAAVAVNVLTGICDGSFLMNRGGFSLGGVLNGRNAIHVPLTGTYRVSMTVSGTSSAGTAIFGLMQNGSTLHGEVALTTGYSVQSNDFTVLLSASDYLNYRLTSNGGTIVGWNTRLLVQWLG